MATDTTLGPEVILEMNKLKTFSNGWEMITRVERLEASVAVEKLLDPHTGEIWDRAKIIWGPELDVWSY